MGAQVGEGAKVYTDVLVIGAGPAGSAAAVALSEAKRDFVVVDRGVRCELRAHDKKKDLAQGVGGAGLFSDGKFSFFPSGSNLYKLSERYLAEAYEWFSSYSEGFGLQCPPAALSDAQLLIDNNGKKKYPSQMLGLGERIEFIARLQRKFEKHLLTECAVESIAFDGDHITSFCRNGQEVLEINSRAIVIATGRFGSTQSMFQYVDSACLTSAPMGQI